LELESALWGGGDAIESCGGMDTHIVAIVLEQAQWVTTQGVSWVL